MKNLAKAFSRIGWYALEWRYYWRKFLPFFPIQFCMICGKPFWAGIPYITLESVKRAGDWDSLFQWLPGWGDYCSQECADTDFAQYEIVED